MNFKDYFTSIKLVNAINLLLSTKHSITTVSELAGFNSHTNFANQFKNYLHFSPKQFRSLVSKITEPPQIHFQQDNVSQFTELISTIDLTAQLATNTTDIHIDVLIQKIEVSVPKYLFDLVISMNYFNLFSMNITILTLSTYQNLSFSLTIFTILRLAKRITTC